MKSVNELRKLIRETFYLMEAPPGGYFKSLDLERDPDKAALKGPEKEDGKLEKKNTIENHFLIGSNLTDKEIDLKFREVMKVIKSNSRASNLEDFNKSLTDLNDKIKKLSKKLKQQLEVGGIIASDKKLFNSFLIDVEKLLKINSPNSLGNEKVKNWYIIKKS
tara:strand:+ start:11810 stop:12298 length:489 start_codon:yes stop_codon:yes gene_type:complete